MCDHQGINYCGRCGAQLRPTGVVLRSLLSEGSDASLLAAIPLAESLRMDDVAHSCCRRLHATSGVQPRRSTKRPLSG